MAHGPALTIMRYALVFLWAARLAAAAEHDPVEVLKLVTRKVLAGTQDIPNYTCVETVTRDYFRPAAATIPRACDVLLEQRRHPSLDMVLRPVSRDRLRLDVTMSRRGEIFSWVGASRFDDAGIENVVRNGPISTGTFGGFLMAVFQNDARNWAFEKTTVVDGRSLMEYSFQVLKGDSHYRVKLDNSWITTAFSGTFQVDPETDDLVRMTVETGELPIATGQCQSTTAMEFGMTPIGDAQFLLPTQTRQRFVNPTGEEAENVTGFTNCREYRGESTLTFFPGPEPLAAGGTRSAPAKPIVFPVGSRFAFELTAPIQGDTAAAGDTFAGKLVEPLRGPKYQMLAPKGTVVEGHLMRVQSFRKPPDLVVVLRPEALEIKGARVPLMAVADWQRVLAERRTKGLKGIEILLPLQGEDNAGAFRFLGEHVLVPKGFRSQWRTVLR
jgi:hypothetical protein